MDKKRIRDEMSKLLETLSEIEVLTKSKEIINRLTESNLYRNAQVIGTYVGVGNEVQTEELIRRAWNEGKQIVVPICQKVDKQLLFSNLRSFTELGEGTYGLREPLAAHQRLVNPKQIELMCVPGLAFDLRGHRIGHGAGYYDRFFANNQATIHTIGLAYENQIIESFKPTQHDIAVQFIITESRFIDCGAHGLITS